MTKLTNAGFERTRLADRYAQIQARARAIFGSDISIESDTMDGQHLGLFAESIADIDELAEAVWLSFDPDVTTGASLSRLVKLNGIERNQGAHSVTMLTLTGDANTLIPAGSLISNASDTVTVYTTNDARLNSDGYAEVYAAAKETGPITAAAGTINRIKSPIYGWKTASNTDAMIPGKIRETDQELRLRRRGSVSRGNRNMTDALWAALSDLDSVTEVAVLENRSNVIDKRGLSPHSIHAVVLGGDDNEIARTIWAGKTGGAQLDGTTTVIVQDAAGGDKEVKFSRPASIAIKVKVNITPRIGWSYKTASQIRDVLFDYINRTQKVGEELITSNLYSPLNEIGGFSINKIYLARKNEAYSTQSLQVGFDERVNIDIADIEVVQS